MVSSLIVFMLLISITIIQTGKYPCKVWKGAMIVYRIKDQLIPQDVLKCATFCGLPKFPFGGFAAQLMYADPPNGCDRIQKPPKDGFTGKWIVMMPYSHEKKNCSTKQKLKVAQEGSYDAMLLHDVYPTKYNPRDTRTVEMDPVYVKANKIHIHGIWTSIHNAALLKDYYLYDKGYFVLAINESIVTVPTHISRPFDYDSALAATSCSVLTAVTFAILLYHSCSSLH